MRIVVGLLTSGLPNGVIMHPSRSDRAGWLATVRDIGV